MKKLFCSVLKLGDNIAQKGDFDSFLLAKNEKLLNAIYVQVTWRLIAKDVGSLSSQSEHTFKAIHCFRIIIELLMNRSNWHFI